MQASDSRSTEMVADLQHIVRSFPEPIGAFASRAWAAHAIWLAASILAVTLVLFIVDERVLR